MIRRWMVLLIATALGAAGGASAADFTATLEVRSPAATATGVEPDGEDVSARLVERPVLHVGVGQRLCATWTVTCTAKEKIPNRLVHFYVAGEQEAGQRETPDLRKPNVAAESAVTMDFDPNDRASAKIPFSLDTPGAYRVQIETLDRGPEREQASAAALDLVVEGGEP